MYSTLTCTIGRKSSSYEIEIGPGVLQSQASFLKSLGRRCALITDEQVARLWGGRLIDSLRSDGLAIECFVIPAGESYKTRATKETLENQLFERGYGRDTCILGLGGGVVTDLAGYLAATYCRGVPLVLMPTTLLAMGDACIGGKNGVNLPYGKNLLGTVHQPLKVCIDPGALQSLPRREFSNGMAEIIKHALIADPELFDFLENNAEQIVNLNPGPLCYMIHHSCRIKKEIVEKDEQDAGQRHLLNFGHTVGHALEHVSNYSVFHGEAVAFGILAESYVSKLHCGLGQDALARMRAILAVYGLPGKLPLNWSFEQLCEAMAIDKKARSGIPQFVLLQDIGCPYVHKEEFSHTVSRAHLENALEWMRNAVYSH